MSDASSRNSIASYVLNKSSQKVLCLCNFSCCIFLCNSGNTLSERLFRFSNFLLLPTLFLSQIFQDALSQNCLHDKSLAAIRYLEETLIVLAKKIFARTV